MPAKYKNLVRERIAKTGESWETAARAVRNQAPAPAAYQRFVHEENGTEIDEDCLGEYRCPLARWDGKGTRPECHCLGVDTSEPLLDGEDYYDF